MAASLSAHLFSDLTLCLVNGSGINSNYVNYLGPAVFKFIYTQYEWTLWRQLIQAIIITLSNCGWTPCRCECVKFIFSLDEKPPMFNQPFLDK